MWDIYVSRLMYVGVKDVSVHKVKEFVVERGKERTNCLPMVLWKCQGGERSSNS